MLGRVVGVTYSEGRGGGTLYKCQYRDVLLTWVGLSAIMVHSWVTNQHGYLQNF